MPRQHMSKGLFITFEGIDGCGKSTQVELARESLSQAGIPVMVTREPGGTPIGEQIRSILICSENISMLPGCELLLYLAARAQHVGEKIVPALEKGMVVLCDRFQEATFAYQGFGRSVSLDVLRNCNRFATGGLLPDYTFVFDVSYETSRERLTKAGKAPDRLESCSREFFEKVREGYATVAATSPERITILSGEKPVHEISQIVARILGTMVENRAQHVR